MRYKQIQKRGKWYSCGYRYGKRFLIVTLTAACLTGRGAKNVAEESLKPVDELLPEPDRGIHFPNEKAADNPFFPERATGDAEVSYLLGMLSEGKATMQMQEELRRMIAFYIW